MTHLGKNILYAKPDDILGSYNVIGSNSAIDGSLEHRDYQISEDINWEVQTGCDSVRVYSTHFDTELNYDLLIINDVSYSGTEPISQIVTSSTFNIRFTSDSSVTATGFEVHWECALETTTPIPTETDSSGTYKTIYHTTVANGYNGQYDWPNT